jgi:hypothetical protein
MDLRRAICGVLLAGSCVAVAGQEPSTFQGRPTDAVVQQRLESGEARLVAWGARAVLVDKRVSLLPEVESLIVGWEPRFAARPALWTQDYRYAMIAMLDTVIQMDGSLPAKTIAGLDRTLDTQRILLLVRMPWDEAGPIWKTLYEPDTTQYFGTTRVAAEMLAAHPPPGFAADLLRRITVNARVEVYSPNSGVGGGGFGGGGVDCGTGPPLSNDWPEVGSYALQDTPKIKGAVLLEGTGDVYVVREVNRRGWPDICGGFMSLTDEMRDQFVGKMINAGGEPIDLKPVVRIEFTTREAYYTRVVAFVEEQQAKFGEVLTRLVARGVMTEDEQRTAALRIRITLWDARGEDAVDLPPIAFRPPVEWVSR